MGEESDVGIFERAKSFFHNKSITPSDKADEFITKNMPEYIEDYKLATRSDLDGIDKRIESFVEEVSNMKEWKEETKEKVEQNKTKIERLEKKLGLWGEK
ncbi:MAG: hypothetical protein ACLFSM_03690 [Thermoplasmata archaeon]